MSLYPAYALQTTLKDLVILDLNFTPTPPSQMTWMTAIAARASLSDFVARVQAQLNLLPPSHHKPRGRVHVQQKPQRHGRVRGAVDQPKVVLDQQVAKDDLELVGGEEAARAGVLAVPETQALRRRADQVRDAVLVGAAPPGVAIGVELEWVLVELGAHPVGRVGADAGALRDEGPVGEGDVALGEPVHGNCGWDERSACACQVLLQQWATPTSSFCLPRTLRLLYDAVKELQVVQCRLLPTIGPQCLDNLVPQLLIQARVLGDLVHGFDQQISCRMDGAGGYGHLDEDGIVRVARSLLLDPVNRVVERGDLVAASHGLLAHPAPLFDDGPNKLPRPVDGATELDAHGVKPVVNAAEDLGLLLQNLGGNETLHRVVLGDLEPFCVAAQFFAEQDPG
ncbi:hypothetical protein PoMZ_09006 [Pyricularia oryzae]|uniref:Uncharacterized protein n=1 Tax=Pyricularia oryzae TaxID=318829 RepID=A0A4P7MSS1_PYROR|nr:hypothetical protein PoMZ_09006 [Pyricularia oryzae]